MPKRGKDDSKPLPRGMEYMQRNVPLNGVRGWQRKKVAVAHADHWPYGTLDFSQASEGKFSSVASNHVASPTPVSSVPEESTSPNPPTHTDLAMEGAHTANFRRGTFSMLSTTVDKRPVRLRRRAARRRVTSPTSGTSTRQLDPSSFTMDDPAMPYPRVTYLSYAETPQQTNHGSEVQSRYTLPAGVNADTPSRSSVLVSMGSFESGYHSAHPSQVDSPQASGRNSTGSDTSRHSAPPNETLSNSHFQQQGMYPDTTAYLNDPFMLDNSFMLNASLPTQHGLANLRNLSIDSSVDEPHRNRRRADYDFRTRVNSHSSIAHAITGSPGNGIQQGVITSNHPSFHVAEHYYPSPHSSSASTTSSQLDSYSPTSYAASSGHITHDLGDIGLQVQPYAGDIDMQHLTLAQNSFPPYTLPDCMGTDGTFHPYHG